MSASPVPMSPLRPRARRRATLRRRPATLPRLQSMARPATAMCSRARSMSSPGRCMCSRGRCTVMNGANGMGMTIATVRAGTATAMACPTARTAAPTIPGVIERRLITAKAGLGFLEAGFFCRVHYPAGALHLGSNMEGGRHCHPGLRPWCNALRVLHRTKIQPMAWRVRELREGPNIQAGAFLGFPRLAVVQLASCLPHKIAVKQRVPCAPYSERRSLRMQPPDTWRTS
jgi:hypothetical protein